MNFYLFTAQDFPKIILLLQTVLKDEVVGLREERGSLEAAMKDRERVLHTQEAEIKDLKDTVAQLQSLVFTTDGEVRGWGVLGRGGKLGENRREKWGEKKGLEREMKEVRREKGR